MEEFDIEEALDEQQDQIDSGTDLQDAQLENYEASYPAMKEQNDLYSWFWNIVKTDQPHKIIKLGNLKKEEIGDHIISVRDSINLANLGHIFHHPTFGDYWAGRAHTTAASSMSKDGWLIEQSISQKRVRERAKKSSPLTKDKWRLFNKKTPEATPGQ
jgi:hypothetical protein